MVVVGSAYGQQRPIAAFNALWKRKLVERFDHLALAQLQAVRVDVHELRRRRLRLLLREVEAADVFCAVRDARGLEGGAAGKGSEMSVSLPVIVAPSSDSQACTAGALSANSTNSLCPIGAPALDTKVSQTSSQYNESSCSICTSRNAQALDRNAHAFEGALADTAE